MCSEMSPFLLYNNLVKNQLSLIFLVYTILKKLDTNYKLANFTYKLLPHYLGIWEMQKVIIQQ